MHTHYMDAPITANYDSFEGPTDPGPGLRNQLPLFRLQAASGKQNRPEGPQKNEWTYLPYRSK